MQKGEVLGQGTEPRGPESPYCVQSIGTIFLLPRSEADGLRSFSCYARSYKIS